MTRTLVVLPSVSAVPEGDALFLDRKAVEGLQAYARLWPGPVRCAMRAGQRHDIAFGSLYRPQDLPVEIRVIGQDALAEPGLFDDAAVIMAAGDIHVDFALAGAVSAPLVYIIEYTLATRLRINRLYNGLSVQMAKSGVWTIGMERRRRRAFARSQGLQCNGTPAFNAYRRLTPAPLLYLDTRTSDAKQIGAEALAEKHRQMRAGGPLRIAFSGRLERMKGADHLLPVADALVRAGLDFTLDVYGDGDLRAGMAARIAATGLGSRVTLHGPVPFEEALIPAMIARTDLFLCCHRQSDPSCTYMETLSCGVPIVGYNNAAFRGITRLGEIGLRVPMDSVDGAAAAIISLSNDRARLVALSTNAAALGREHSFEREFERRIDHLRQVAGL